MEAGVGAQWEPAAERWPMGVPAVTMVPARTVGMTGSYVVRERP